ncbi:HvfA family oxazolone/thioamide-modified RiPP metallophore [Pseudomonas tohonis]|uniref:HvfA family oxazolone/thioamide-modified RiPP metallophore n=1 Tax=Pseudomonas tohonis TaxID=2725477 RepID=UPI0021DB0C6A|nr:EF-hand domain-containing protein [Pseudomonas tohonis]UXY50279.1 EF-hand domain-containing protein [Pseudomonas tohonis]
MSHTPLANKSRIGLLAVALAGGLNIASSAAFAVEALPQGYQLAAADKAAEGKCGEGKCGSSGASAKATQGEGKCGEGKCGDASFARTDTDHDGRVSLAELLAVAPKGGEEFKAIDTNGDGYLSEAEVYKFRSNQYLSNGKKVPTELFTHMSQAKD